MATIIKDIAIAAPAEQVWDAMRDVGALHTRLVPGFVTGCQMDGDARVVSFANGMSARERIVTVDDTTRRLVWTIVGGRMSHHNGSTQVFDAGPGQSRVVWIADILPDELAPAIDQMMSAGAAAMAAAFVTPR